MSTANKRTTEIRSGYGAAWRQMPAVMRAVKAAGYYPGYLDGTPRSALEQREKNPTRIGVSVLKSKQKPKVLAQIVWSHGLVNDGKCDGDWTVYMPRRRRSAGNRALLQLEKLFAQSGLDVIIGSVPTSRMPLYR